MKIGNDMTDFIGNTPVVKLKKTDDDHADIYAKLEFMNPASSVKDRIALAMVEAAEESGELKPGGTILEPTSGNTGIGLAMVAAAKGYTLIVVMPDTMSMERRNLLRAHGAELILTPGSEGMSGAIKCAEELKQEHGYFMPQQFDNPANPRIHGETTGKEIVSQMEDGLDAFVSGVGTGGTITGAGKVLKEAFSNVLVYAVEPTDSAVLSGGSPSPHKLQGLGAGFVPSVLDTSVYDDVIQITNEEAFSTTRNIAKSDGVLGGISSGAAVAAAQKVAAKLGAGKKVLAILPDNGERYLSTPVFQFEE